MMQLRHISLSLALAATATMAQTPADEPLWMRGGQISPDGQQIAFSYMGNLYTVPATGGAATQLTTHQAYDGQPMWSPDGTRLAFASNREGALDVYVMPATGGTATRLTTHSLDEIPSAWLDADHLLIRRTGDPTPQDIVFPSSVYPRIYQIDAHRPSRQTLFSALSMDHISIGPDGRILYTNIKGYEDPWRKHHTSSVARDICLKDGDTYSQLTTFAGEDRNAVWSADGQGYYYLSEQSGCFNVWHATLEGIRTQLTHFAEHPVRYLSIAQNGLLAFAHDGQLFTLKPGAEPQKVEVKINSDIDPNRTICQLTQRGATQVVVSPTGKEVAFVLADDVYVTTLDFATTKQITCTPERERRIDFRPDGRAIIYDSEQGGVWSLYQAEIAKDKEPCFTHCSQVNVTRLTDGATTSFQPLYSPDGKSVAYLENREALCVIDLKNGKKRTVMDAKYAYSYTDGDQYFTWSPDSRYLLAQYIGNGGWNNTDIALVYADGKSEPVNLTQSGYSEGQPRWVLDGKAMIFGSDRAGYRSHGSWGAQDDVYITFFCPEAYAQFLQNKEDRAIAREMQSEKEKKEEKKDSTAQADKPKQLELCLDNLEDRTLRLTTQSTFISDAVMNREGTKLIYIASHNGGMGLWVRDFLDERTELRMASISASRLRLDEKNQVCYFVGPGGTLQSMSLATPVIKNIPFEAYTTHQPARVQAYQFHHIWRQTKEKLYDPAMNGANWDSLHTVYQRFLPHINNGYDFAEMTGEMLGELNSSHTGCRYNAPGAPMATAQLGVLLDQTQQQAGLRILEVLPGSPLEHISAAKPGAIITAIDGQPIDQDDDYFPLLAGKAGRTTRLTLKGEKHDIVVRPITQARHTQLLYNRWVRRNEHIVDSLSGGRLAYVHIKAMNAESFHQFYMKLLSDRNRQRQAVIVDTRHNGGGWLHNDVCIALSGKVHSRFAPRGKYIGNDPFDRWTKPSCMLVCEDCYSNAHGTPWLYKEMNIGKLIGTSVPGTMTAVWWENLGQYTFGIPQVGILDSQDRYLENNPLQPDVECHITPAHFLSGRDTQIEAAVQELLK